MRNWAGAVVGFRTRGLFLFDLRPLKGREETHMPIKKILVVDDSPTERYFLTELLTKNGFSVSAAENADDAVMKLKAAAPDLILMDVVMPGQNGFQLTRQLSKEPATQAIPIIICTSKNQQTDRVWALRQGAKDFVTKPVKPDELLEKIAALGS
jgi:twitching motility two-component system response regulator PilH